ncbi:acyltransferase family protein [Eisenbergiella porci]|uniref:acyltransferase family protein n=1 Tax=Eisenbergiella porci TaxID=2652274 RepID=UPI002A807386|nr:acyltransferase family protein [Eisenbergiella porci]
MGCYIIYYLIHPLLNRAVKGLEQTDFKKMVIILFALYSVLGCVQQEYYYTNLVGFICIHYFVMYYKKYGINAGTNTREILSTGNIKRDVIAIVLSVAAILIWICVLNFVGQYITVLSDKGLFLCTFMNPLIVVISLAALDIAVHTKPHEIKWVNAFTKNSLLIYLLHGSYYWLTYGKYTLHAVLNSCGIPALGRMLIISAIYMIATPLLSAIYNKITDKRFNRISSLLAEKIMK